jgi:hypothetical protein
MAIASDLAYYMDRAETLIHEIDQSLYEYESTLGQVVKVAPGDPIPQITMSPSISVKIELAKLYISLTRTLGGR